MSELKEKLEKWAEEVPCGVNCFDEPSYVKGGHYMLDLLWPVIAAAQGCSDGNCVLTDRDGGMHTNGGCRCKRNIKAALAELERAL